MSENDSSSSLTDMEKDFVISELRKELRKLSKKVVEYEKTLNSYDIDEIEVIDDVEYICVEEIKKLKALSDAGGLTDIDVKNLDTLHKNLRQVRGQEVSKKKLKEKSTSVAELLSIVNDEKN